MELYFLFYNLNKKTVKNIFNNFNKVKNNLEKYGKNVVKMEFDLLIISIKKLVIYNIITSLISITLLMIFDE